jgi:hypothetical protein
MINNSTIILDNNIIIVYVWQYGRVYLLVPGTILLYRSSLKEDIEKASNH